MRKHNKNLFRILCLILVLHITFGTTVFADALEKIENTMKDDLDYMEDVYKYDVPYLNKVDVSTGEQEENVEILKYEKADNIMAALGIFSFDAKGNYNEDDIVSYKDFITALIKLERGEAAEGESYGEDLTKDENVTHLLAARKIMTLLGYVVESDDDSYVFKTAKSNKLFSKISYNASKHITRGELSQMLYNALDIELMELVSVGPNHQQYDISSGDNLLYKTFGLIEVNGLCTAANGVDIYTNAKLEEDDIHIDRHSFKADGVDVTSLLGKKVYALCNPDDECPKITYINVDEKDVSVKVSFNDLTISDNTLSYMDGDTRKRISIAGIKTYSYNGDSVLGFTFNDSLLSSDGYVILTSSDTGGNYDIAIINKLETFVVERVSKLSEEKVYFKYGMKFDGVSYIDLEDDGNKIIHIIKNGKKSTIEDISVSDVISVLKSADGDFVYAEVSNRSIKGEIEAIQDENILIINEQEYFIADSYLKAITSGADVVAPKIGTNVIARLSADGHIADIQLAENINKYALFKGIYEAGSQLRRTYQLYAFTESGGWEALDLANKITLDGKVKISSEEAYLTLCNETENIKYKPIRYKQNGDGLVTFLDTALNTRLEGDDKDAIVQSTVWPGVDKTAEIDWTRGHNLYQSTYSLHQDAKIFFIPDKLEDEEDYRIYKRSQLPTESQANFVIYNADDFFRGQVAIYTGPTSASASFASEINFMISKILVANNEDGEEVYKLRGFLTRETGAMELELYTTGDIKEEYPDLAVGDTISYVLDSDGAITKLGVYGTYDKISNQSNDKITLENYNEAIGEVLSVDIPTRMIKIRVGEERFDKTNEYSFEEEGCVLYDSATKEVMPITLSEIGEGDRVLLRGLYRYIGVFVYR